MPRRDLHDAHDIFARPRNDHAERIDSVDAGVGGVQRARDSIEPHLAFDLLFELDSESIVHVEGICETDDTDRHDGTEASGAYLTFGWHVCAGSATALWQTVIA